MDDIAYMTATQEEKYALVKAETKRLQEKLNKPLNPDYQPRRVVAVIHVMGIGSHAYGWEDEPTALRKGA